MEGSLHITSFLVMAVPESGQGQMCAAVMDAVAAVAVGTSASEPSQQLNWMMAHPLLVWPWRIYVYKFVYVFMYVCL